MKKVLAIDMGATSIRGVVGFVENDRLQLQEVMRFSHDLVEQGGRRRWQWARILAEITRVLNEHRDLDSVACDTWGVDFGVLDENGQLLAAPVSYRDSLHQAGFEAVAAQMDLYKLFSMTGNQIMSINSLFQLMTLKEVEPEIYDRMKHLLMTPDLVHYFLTGEMRSEMTIASTSQMFDLKNGRWQTDLLERLGLKTDIFAPLIRNGECVGTTANTRLSQLKNRNLKVYSVASHDTASAVAVTRAFFDPDCLFLSSGTWSLIGGLSPEPILSREAFDYDLTNETGYLGRNMFFKNITGLYLIEKLRDELEAANGFRYSFAEITRLVEESEPFRFFLDIDQFDLDRTTALDTLREFAEKTGQTAPQSDGERFRSIYESMVLGYMRTVRAIERVFGKTHPRLQIIGGGSRAELLCQMVADGLNKEVTAGPDEASATGNIVAQLLAEGQWNSLEEAYATVAGSFDYRTYYTRNHQAWQQRYEECLPWMMQSETKA